MLELFMSLYDENPWGAILWATRLSPEEKETVLRGALQARPGDPVLVQVVVDHLPPPLP